MIPYTSFISWRIGFVEIQSWGLLVAIGVLAALFYVIKTKKHLDKDHVYSLFFYGILGGLIGSRLLHIIEFYHEYDKLLDFFLIWKGGLSWFGGFVLAFAFVIIYIKVKKLDFWKYTDAIFPSIALGQFFGRIGCILGDGGHVGKLTDKAWGFLVNGEIRHVTAYYSAIYLIIIFFILHFLSKKNLKKGLIFSFYLLLYSIARFIMEFFRIDPTYLGLTLAQYFAIVMFVASIILMFVIKKK